MCRSPPWPMLLCFLLLAHQLMYELQGGALVSTLRRLPFRVVSVSCAAGAFEACLREYYAAGEAGALEASAFGSFVCLLPPLAGGTAAGAVPASAT